MSAVDTQSFPRGVLAAAISVIAFSIVITAVARYTHIADPEPMAPALATATLNIDLKFADRADGGVVVSRAESGTEVAVIPPKTGGFVRGVLRSLTRERAMHGIGSGPAFRLSQWANGHVEIEDLADGRRIDLDAFGQTNREAFLKLLPGARVA
jgi:putative photosynthetic complex assembly protein